MIRIAALALLLMVTGCAATQPSIGIDTALRGLSSGLRAAGALGVPATADWSPEQKASFARAVRAAQCAEATADPEITLLQHDVNVTLSGTFSSSGGFAVSGVGAVPSASLTSSSTATHEQQISLPVTFVTLSGLADAVAAHRMGLFKDLPKELQVAMSLDVLRQHAAIGNQANALRDSFDLAACALGQTQAGPLMAIKFHHM